MQKLTSTEFARSAAAFSWGFWQALLVSETKQQVIDRYGASAADLSKGRDWWKKHTMRFTPPPAQAIGNVLNVYFRYRALRAAPTGASCFTADTPKALLLLINNTARGFLHGHGPLFIFLVSGS